MTIVTGPVLTARNLHRRFRRGAEQVRALAGVSVDLYAGELTVAAGPSGSGKTTLLSVLAGIERADQGTVTVTAPRSAATPHHLLPWSELAFVPQALALLDEFTVAENVALPELLAPTAHRDEAPRECDPPRGDDSPRRDDSLREDLAALEIEQLAQRYPSQISGGEQQRTAIARALRLRPAVLLADEPTGHQDRDRVQLVLDVLRSHAYRGAAVLITSHDQDVIAGADRLITVGDGAVIADQRVRAAQLR